MLKFLGQHYYDILALALVAGSVLSPVTSVIGVLIIFAAKLVDKYFSSNITDQDRKDLAILKSDYSKIKLKIETQDLGKAFQGRT